MAEGLTHDQIIQRGFDENNLPSGYYRSDAGGGGSYSDTVRRAIQMNQDAARPAIQSLESSIPETQQVYAQRKQQLQAEVDPLKQRYANLLSEIKGNQQTAENRQTVVTNNELGKRGILGSSTLAQQEITNAVNPITKEYTGLYKDTALQGEKDLRELLNGITNLTGDETTALRAIRNAIGQLQSGASTSGITQGLAQDQADRDRAWQEKVYKEITLPESIYNRNKPYSSGGDSVDLEGLQSLIKTLGGGGSSTPSTAQPTEPKPTVTPRSKDTNVNFHSPDGQWIWDWESKDWYPVVG